MVELDWIQVNPKDARKSKTPRRPSASRWHGLGAVSRSGGESRCHLPDTFSDYTESRNENFRKDIQEFICENCPDTLNLGGRE
jgi:hypothetical protein